LDDPETRSAIYQIEQEEWDHRRQVGDMLAVLGASPSALLELKAAAIGALLGPLCHVSGWLLPMFGAAWLEQQNVVEYSSAARLASGCGRAELVPALERMADVELQHERYFRQQVASHRLGRIAVRLLGSPTGGSPETRHDDSRARVAATPGPPSSI
jgi:rubrerythrin